MNLDKINAIFLMFFFILLAGCNFKNERAFKLYQNRDFLLREFSGISIIKRGDNFVQLSFYKRDEVNTFFFERKDTIWNLTNDTLQYSINEIEAFTSLNIQDLDVYKRSVTNEMLRLLLEMKRLGVTNVNSGFASIGVNLKVYFDDYRALLYVKDIANVKNERWKMYLNSGIRFDENWYYVKDDL